MRHHFTPVRMAIINKSTDKCWRGCGEKGTLVYCWWECRLVRPLWKTVWNFLRKLKMELPFDLAILLLGLYPENPEAPFQKNLCTPMFIAAQFTKPSTGGNLSAYQQTSGSQHYGIFTEWNSMQQRERSLYPLRQHGWNWKALC